MLMDWQKAVVYVLMVWAVAVLILHFIGRKNREKSGCSKCVRRPDK